MRRTLVTDDLKAMSMWDVVAAVDGIVEYRNRKLSVDARDDEILMCATLLSKPFWPLDIQKVELLVLRVPEEVSADRTQVYDVLGSITKYQNQGQLLNQMPATDDADGTLPLAARYAQALERLVGRGRSETDVDSIVSIQAPLSPEPKPEPTASRIAERAVNGQTSEAGEQRTIAGRPMKRPTRLYESIADTEQRKSKLLRPSRRKGQKTAEEQGYLDWAASNPWCHRIGFWSGVPGLEESLEKRALLRRRVPVRVVTETHPIGLRARRFATTDPFSSIPLHVPPRRPGDRATVPPEARGMQIRLTEIIDSLYTFDSTDTAIALLTEAGVLCCEIANLTSRSRSTVWSHDWDGIVWDINVAIVALYDDDIPKYEAKFRELSRSVPKRYGIERL